MPSTPPLAALADLVLTTDRSMRSQLRMCLTSAATYLFYAGLMWAQVGLGYTPSNLAAWCTLVALGVNLLLYTGIRRGWGPPQDRGLGTTQLLVGIVFMWVAYAVAGPMSGATLIIVASHIVYAVFGFTAQRVWQLVAGSLAGLALTMLLCHQWQPDRYPLGHQAVAWLYTCLGVVLIARLATLVTRMTENLRTQRRELAAALDKVREVATRDDLTQVHNRRHFTELMLIEQAQHERSGAPLCLALVDIDFFKVVNDTFGHHAGDDVLRRFAQAAHQALRTSDLLGRWGGEEFAVVFPDTLIAQARVALRRVREQLQQTDFSAVGPGLRITFSAGLVQLAPGERVDDAIERADQAMYRAKAKGRDRIECVAPIDRFTDSSRRA